MTGDDLASLVDRGDRLRSGTTELSASHADLKANRCPPLQGGVFLCPENRGQAVTQGGLDQSATDA